MPNWHHHPFAIAGLRVRPKEILQFLGKEEFS